MNNSEAAKKVRQMFRNLGAPPPPDAAVGNLERLAPASRERSDRTEQLNLRVAPALKRRVRLLASRDDISLSEVVVRAIALYEEKYGAAPEV